MKVPMSWLNEMVDTGMAPKELAHRLTMAGLEAETREGRTDGFGAKVVIHPSHVAVVNRVYTPDKAELAWARRVVAAFAANPAAGVVRMDGRMVDKPHLRLAERLIASAE